MQRRRHVDAFGEIVVADEIDVAVKSAPTRVRKARKFGPDHWPM
jgi:hypothetical protein